MCTYIDIWLICCREERATFPDLPTVPGQGSRQGEQLNSAIYHLYTHLHCFAAGVCSFFRIAPFSFFFPPVEKKNRQNTTQEGRRMDTALADPKAPRSVAAPAAASSQHHGLGLGIAPSSAREGGGKRHHI